MVFENLKMDRIVDFIMNETFSNENVDLLFFEIREFPFDKEPPDFELDHDHEVKPSTSKTSHSSVSSRRRIMEEEEILFSLEDLNETQQETSTEFREAKNDDPWFNIRDDSNYEGTSLIEREYSNHDYRPQECSNCVLMESKEIFLSLEDQNETPQDILTDYSDAKSDDSWFKIRNDLNCEGTSLIGREYSNHDYGPQGCPCCCVLI